MAEKFDRKKLKEPDDFISFTQRSVEWALANRVMLVAGILALGLMVVGVFAYRWYALDLEQKASAAFATAQKIYDAPVVNNPEQALSGKVAAGTFASPDEKYKAASDGFEKVIKDHGGSRITSLARYYAGECQLRMKSHDKAIEFFELYLKDAGPDSALASLAVEGIAAAYEAQGKLDEARKQYERLKQEPFIQHKDRGMYHLALMEAVAGNKEAAALIFMQLQQEHPESAFLREAQERLTVLPVVELPKKADAAGDPETKKVEAEAQAG
ncbi:MAG: tetratricopeptide repeat protein [Deltaproteobacteria bacterium]|nr:tetratricopeptide repeat protein [Deltaproteobacteria bacterium]